MGREKWLKSICRLCLTKDKGLKSIFQHINMLTSCANISISENDSLPHTVCDECIEKAKKCIEFKDVCEQSESILKGVLITKIEIEEQQFIDDPVTESNLELSNERSLSESINTIVENDFSSSIGSIENTNNTFLNIKEENATGIQENTKLVNVSKTSAEKIPLKKNTLKSKTLQCEFCDQTYVFLRYLNLHVKKAHSPSERNSNACKEQNVSKTKETVKVKSVNREEGNTSDSEENDTCTNSATENAEVQNSKLTPPVDIRLSDDIRKRYLSKQKIHACTICDRVYVFPHNLKVHMKNAHPRFNTTTITTNVSKNDDDATYQDQPLCCFCGKFSTSRSNLRQHERLHAGEYEYQCHICAKKFPMPNNLRSHLITHSTEKPLQCTICGKRFKRNNVLRKHMRDHSTPRIRNHVCTICNKAFFDSSTMKRHAKDHQDDRSHICKVCNKGFKRRSHLYIHEKIHTDYRPHACTICDKKFLQKHVLISHLKVHYKCSDSN